MLNLQFTIDGKLKIFTSVGNFGNEIAKEFSLATSLRATIILNEIQCIYMYVSRILMRSNMEMVLTP